MNTLEVKKNFLNRDITITNLKSFFACQVAQTTMAGIFSFYRGLDTFSLLKNRKKMDWRSYES